MTDEAQRMGIAEFCGWKLRTVTQEQSAYYGTPLSTKAWFPPDNREWDDLECPDFLHDLNAVREAEEKVKNYEGNLGGCTYPWGSYRDELNNVCGGHWSNAKETDIFHATARQRCEALLKTIGKWVES